MSQCQYIIPKTGEQCKRNVEPESDYCWQHKDIVKSQLIPELENLMSEYTDYKTYQELIKYDPNTYSLEKYEINIANSESQRQDELLVSLLKELEERKYVNTDERKSMIQEELANLSFENIESTLQIMVNLGILEYGGEEGNEVLSSGNIRLGVKLLLNPKGYDDLTGLNGDITLSDDSKNLLFMNEEEDFEYPLQLTPLYKLLYKNMKVYMKNIKVYMNY